MKNRDAWIKPFCACLAALMLLMTPLDGALAARYALVKKADTTARASADCSGKAVFTLSKGTRVTVKAVKGSVAKVVYKGKTAFILTSYLSLAAAKAEETKVLRDVSMYKEAKTSSKKLAALSAGDVVALVATKGDWAKIRQGDGYAFIPKAAFDAPVAKTLSAKSAAKATEKTMTTKVNAKFFARASQSAAYKKVKAGTSVTILDEKSGWYKVKKSGVTGYMLKKVFVDAKPKATSAPAYKTLKKNATGSSVLKMQKQLEALGYLDIVPNGKYASTTAAAVKLFQSANGLSKSGVADSATQAALYSDGAKKSGMLSASIKPGDKGTGVQRLQMRLRSKGYYAGKVNGKYDAATKTAVMAYQIAARLTKDGKAGPATLASLYSAKAPKASQRVLAAVATVAPAPTATPKPTAAPKPTATPKPAATKKPAKKASSKAEKVIAVAKAKLGKPYVFGAVGPRSYDCSGLLMEAYREAGVSLPHSAYIIGYSLGKKVSRSELERGDIVCFNTIADSDLSDHVGIYLGGGSFLHASSGQGRVVISTLTGFYANAFSWGRSVL